MTACSDGSTGQQTALKIQHSTGLLIKKLFVNFLPEFEDARIFTAIELLTCKKKKTHDY
jgi:hypothetical protein